MPVDALPGIVSPFTASVLDNGALLHELADGFGGPLHYLDPQAMVRNIEAYRAAHAGVVIAFAKKANKASAFVDTAIQQGIGIDVASLPELEHALARGCANVSVSGGNKSHALLERAVGRAVVICDTDDELEHLTAVAKSRGVQAAVQLRFRPQSQGNSRFGFAEGNLAAIANIIDRAHVNVRGVAFHCSGYDVSERVRATKSALQHLNMLRVAGHTSAHVVNIGGGFTVRYRDHDVSLSDPRDFHAGHVPSSVYPYAAGDGPSMLRAIADAAGLTPETTLMIEPGRSLLDQAGFSAFRVTGVRERSGYGIVTVDGTSFSLSESWFGSEFLVDPVLVPRRPTVSTGTWHGCIAGGSCLESDMLAWRKIPFATKPQPNDLLVFVNTAGYQMDSNESEFHSLPVPKKIVLSARPTGGVRWRLDGVRL